jgi:hypothetical protein
MLGVPHQQFAYPTTCVVYRLYNVLDGKKEQERILYSDEDPEHGFILNVDTKWKAHPNCLEVPRDQWRDHPSE